MEMIFSTPPNEGQRKPGAGDVFAPSGELRTEVLAPATLQALKDAVRWASETRWDSLRTPHIFMGLLSQPDARIIAWATLAGTDLADLLSQFREIFQQPQPIAAPLRLHREFFSDNVLDLLRSAWQRCLSSGRCHMRLIDLLVVIFQRHDNIVAGCFEEIGLSAKQLTGFALEAEKMQPPK